jgi:hypothetical protein
VTEKQRSPDDIRDDIEQTREELGDTAAALAQKADVKGQTKAKASKAKGKAKAKATEAKQKASTKAEAMKQTAAAKKDEVAGKAQEATPDSVGTGVQQAQRYARENPAALAIGGAFVAGFFLGRRRSRR